MKITVKNLGAVKEAEINLKPLTVFVGHNGTGKTWTAYALAAIFSPYGLNKYLSAYLQGQSRHKYPILEQAIDKFLQEGSAEIDLVEFAEQHLQDYINDVASFALGGFRTFLSTRRVDFEDLSVLVDIDDDKKAELIKNIQMSSLDNGLIFSSRKLNVFKEKNTRYIFFSMEEMNKNKHLQDPVPQKVRGFIGTAILGTLHQIFFKNTRLFPIERVALISDSRDIGNDLFGVKHSSYPVKAFKSMLLDAQNISLDDRVEQAVVIPEIKAYLELAEFLESGILYGKGEFEQSEFGQQLLFVTENVKLEMNVTSSMTKELMPLVLYLRYFAEPNDLIVIDEPEMNLHPAAQVEIIEFLAMLVNAGLNVLITTHSPYIVDHISNLIEAKKQPDPNAIKEYFYLEDARAFIVQEQVSVQLFEDNTAKNILDEDGGINWETFWNVSSDVSGIYEQLLKSRTA